MAWGDPQDYWWLRRSGEQPTRLLPWAQMAQQQRQQQMANEMRQKEMGLEAQRTGLQLVEYFNKKELQNKLIAGNAAMAKSLAGITDWTDPSIPTTLLSIGERYPETMSGEPWKGAMKMHEDAVQAKQKREQLQRFHDEAGFVPADEETGAPAYYKDANGRIRFAPLPRQQPGDPVWVPEDKEGGVPAHFKLPNGRVQFPPSRLADGTVFEPREFTTPGGTTLVEYKKNHWGIVDRNRPRPGSMTDVEKAKVTDLRSKRNTMMREIEAPSALVDAMLRASKDPSRKESADKAQANYAKQLNEIDGLTKELNALYDKIDARAAKGPEPQLPQSPKAEQPAPAAPAPGAPAAGKTWNYNPKTGQLEEVPSAPER